MVHCCPKAPMTILSGQRILDNLPGTLQKGRCMTASAATIGYAPMFGATAEHSLEYTCVSRKGGGKPTRPPLTHYPVGGPTD